MNVLLVHIRDRKKSYQPIVVSANKKIGEIFRVIFTGVNF